MTLTDARKILEEHLAWMQSTYDEPEPPRPDQEMLYEAIDLAIKVLPGDPPRPTCEERFRQITEAVRVQYDIEPFATRSRDKSIVCWRQCVWMRLKNEGYPNYTIARTTGWDHATVWWGIARIGDYLAAGDRMASATWEALISIKIPRNQDGQRNV